MTKTRQHLSFSALKAFSQSPNHLLAYDAKEFAPSPAMKFGTAFHSYLLEREKFAKQYFVGAVDRRTKVGKALALSVEEAGQTPISDADHYRIRQMAKQCGSYTIPDKRETLVEGEIGGVPFKGFVDAMNDKQVWDVKTCQDASPEVFAKTALNFKYHMQAAIYAELTGVDSVSFLAVESAAPYNACLHHVGGQMLELGRMNLHYLIDKWKEWDGTPEGYGQENTLTLPTWAK